MPHTKSLSKDALISVIITTYNRPDALAFILNALQQQTDQNFEVVIADDGSKKPTSDVIEKLKPQLPFSIQHVWQEDLGYKAAQIRNKAAAKANGEYIIFLDGDSVPLPHFVERHRALSETGFFVFGNRLLLSETFTKKVLASQQPVYKWSKLKWFQAKLQKKCNRFLPLFYLRMNFWRKFNKDSWRSVKTCNLGLFKKDFYEVNGFDESYKGWGYEDSDLAIRLLNKKVMRKQGRFALVVLHLWHRENDRSTTAENLKRLQEREKSKTIWAEIGVDQHLAS